MNLHTTHMPPALSHLDEVVVLLCHVSLSSITLGICSHCTHNTMLLSCCAMYLLAPSHQVSVPTALTIQCHAVIIIIGLSCRSVLTSSYRYNMRLLYQCLKTVLFHQGQAGSPAM